jgi:phosphatidate cytidylyltransferase
LSVLDRNLAARVGTAAVALPALLAAFFLGPWWLGVAVIAAACLVALHETFGFWRARGLTPLRPAGYAVLALVFAEVVRPEAWPPLLPGAVVVVLGLALTQARTMETSLSSAALTFLGAAYLGALGGCMAALVALGPREQGPWRIALLMAIVMTSDTAAFFAGKLWGKRKLAPLISPGKTVAGAVGAMVGGIPPALAIRAAGLPDVPILDAVLLGIAVAAFGMIGDLAESLMKRWAGVKDSGTLFPGHGGMLDRLDSLLFGAPVLYYYFLVR